MKTSLRSNACPAYLRACGLLLSLLFAAPLLSQSSLNGRTLAAPIDLADISLRLGQCLGRGVQVREDHLSGEGDRLSILLDPHVSEAGGSARFYVTMRYREAAGQWEPQSVNVIGELSVASLGGNTMRVDGLVTPRDAEMLHGVISAYWEARVGAAPIKLDSIQSSRRPQLHCEYDGLEPLEGVARYQVQATDSEPPTLNETRSPRGRIIDEVQHQTAPLYYFHLRQDTSDGAPRITRVGCALPVTCDERTLAALKPEQAAESPDPLDDAALRRTMLSVLPPEFVHAEIRETEALRRGNQETVVIELAAVSLSELRNADSVLFCGHDLNRPEAWECSHRVTEVLQSVPGTGVLARMMRIDLSEPEVNDLVETTIVRVGAGDIEFFLLRPAPGGGYHVSLFQHGDDRAPRRRQAWFSPSLELTRVE